MTKIYAVQDTLTGKIEPTMRTLYEKIIEDQKDGVRFYDSRDKSLIEDPKEIMCNFMLGIDLLVRLPTNDPKFDELSIDEVYKWIEKNNENPQNNMTAFFISNKEMKI